MGATLEAIGLGRRFGRRNWAVRDCSFTVPAGQVVALVGANGAGKSTLLRLAAGLIRPTEGVIRVGGLPASQKEALGRVAYVGQSKPLYPSFTVAEMVRFGAASNPGFDRRGTTERLKDLKIALDAKVGRLSGGQRTQVAIALALGKRADIVLLDEPMADLDPLARTALLGELMTFVADRQCTVVLSSHALSELSDVCETLLLMNEGGLQVGGAIDDLVGGHRLLVGPADAYAGGDRLGAHEVISARTTDRQAVLLTRLRGSLVDPRWSVHSVTLTDVVLAYLARPDLTSLPAPRSLGDAA